MKHFIVDIQYLVPVDQLADILPAHRAFLQTGYENGLLLLSGPKEPRTGGLLVARSESLDALREFFSHDPYHLNNLALHTFTEFNPVLRQSWLEDWVNG
jgi:uncharacterized protein YciI